MLEDILNATRNKPIDWIPSLPKAHDQSDESYEEQCAALQIGIDKIQKKFNGFSTNHYCITGPPGAGKSLISKLLFICGSCLGLNAAVTSMPSEQSNQSGGTHFHLLLKMIINDKMDYHPTQEANQCICTLTRNEASLACLYDIDILVIEEIGLVNSEFYSTIELVLQHVMDNDLKASGKLTISNGDPHQLMNIGGSSFWLSNHFTFQHDVALLQHYVRAASDPILQKILHLLRKIKPLSKEEKDWIVNSILTNCAFVDS